MSKCRCASHARSAFSQNSGPGLSFQSGTAPAPVPPERLEATRGGYVPPLKGRLDSGYLAGEAKEEL